jgi:uncharacterized protein
MYKKKFEIGSYNLKVRRSKTGLGLFSYEPIKKGSCIIEYTGRTLSEKEQYESNSKYLFEVNKIVTIDGAVRSNTARYINHSCRPNCEIDIYRGRVYVLAKRNIKAGEELTYDYDTEYFDEYIKPVGCKCEKCLVTVESGA